MPDLIFQLTDVDGDHIAVKARPLDFYAASVQVTGRIGLAQSVYLSPIEARELAAALLEVAGDA
jgi:hypothetical protein